MSSVTYQLEPDLTPQGFIDVLVRSTLAERAPIHAQETIGAMLKNADVILVEVKHFANRVFAPKVLNLIAQGRAAHPGTRADNRGRS